MTAHRFSFDPFAHDETRAASSRRSPRRGPQSGPAPPGPFRAGWCWRTVSDTHVTAAMSSTRSRALDNGQNRFHRSPVKETGCPDPGCLPSTSAPRTPLSRVVCLVWEPATDLAALPRTIRLPALFHPSLRSRAEELDLPRDPRALRSWARRAARRPSTSAIVAIREHDHGRPNSAVPHPQSPAGAASLPTVAFRRRRAADGHRISRSCSQPRGHGPGASSRGAWPRGATSPPRSLAVKASPQPDRLGHLLSRARGSRRLETPAPPDPPSWTLFELTWRVDACAPVASVGPLPRARPDRAASRALPRRRSRSAAPEVPSIVGLHPVRGFASAPTSCPQPVDS